MDTEKRDEWLRLMLELAALDRDAYREVRAEAWQRVARRHAAKSPQEIADWERSSS